MQYDRITVLLLDVVKRQEVRIAALEARLAALNRKPTAEELPDDEGSSIS